MGIISFDKFKIQWYAMLPQYRIEPDNDDYDLYKKNHHLIFDEVCYRSDCTVNEKAYRVAKTVMRNKAAKYKEYVGRR